MILKDKVIVLGVTGGIAAYKACDLVRKLQEQGAVVHVAMTEAATHFVGSASFAALSGNPVWIDQWDARMPNNMAHIDLTRRADLVVVVPATADFIAKLAHGTADDLLSTLCLARTCPLLVAPAMNKQMWENPATQRNLRTISSDGVVLLGPNSGSQACGEFGHGRMLEPTEIVEELITFVQPKLLAGKRVMLTAGPTFEALDPVRGLTNHSSGKMGYALARACHEAGAQVLLVSGPTALAAPRAVACIRVESAVQMFEAVMQQAKHVDVFIAVAAVADWRPVNTAKQKMKKNGAPPAIELVENPDILASVAALKKPPYCVGFAAETQDLEKNAQAKRVKKNIPLLVANLGQLTFGKDDNRLMLIDKRSTTVLEQADKLTLSRQLVKHIASNLSL
jgi:phosphopantothenoylcysteine decarboxylase / phosphopantothenate---cysteine ligase